MIDLTATIRVVLSTEKRRQAPIEILSGIALPITCLIVIMKPGTSRIGTRRSVEFPTSRSIYSFSQFRISPWCQIGVDVRITRRLDEVKDFF